MSRYIFYQINVSDSNNNYLTLENYLFGAVKLTKNADIDKCKYSGIGFDRRGNFSFPTGRFGYHGIVFGVDMSSSVHVDILVEGPTQRLDDTTLTAEKSIQLILLNLEINFV